VLEGFDDAGVPRLRPARKPVTLRQLLTHTAGFGYHLFNPDVARYLDYTGIPDVGQCRNETLLTPLVCDPGERFEYGINIDWVGKIVERLSGQSLEDYFREHIFGPLQMNDSGFLLRPDQRTRLAGMHQRQPDGSLVAREFEMSQQPEFFMGGGGLYSTGADYLRLLRMLMGDGQLDGVRLLRSETVAAMGTNHIGALSLGRIPSAVPCDTNEFEFFPGLDKKWGLASMITMEETPAGRSAGSLAWGGLANTYFWIDPHRHITGLFMTQILPFADPDVLTLFEQFERGIYAAHAAHA
jgi:CubicO group peptidase (beta-lactamase class C family)